MSYQRMHPCGKVSFMLGFVAAAAIGSDDVIRRAKSSRTSVSISSDGEIALTNEDPAKDGEFMQKTINKNHLRSDSARPNGPDMRGDDPSQIEGSPEHAALVELTTGTWPQVAEGFLCAQDSVAGMIGVSYSMYSVFEKDADFGTRAQAACKESGCVPILPFRRNVDITAARCEDNALMRSHPYYALGLSPTTGKDMCYSFSSCEESGRVAASGFTIYGREAETTSSVTATPITCTGEAAIRTEILSQLQGQPYPTDETSDDSVRAKGGRAAILRAVFHDANDFNSLNAVNKSTNKWAHVASTTNYAGVDGCIFDNTPVEHLVGDELDMLIGTAADGSSAYNFNLQRWPQNQDPQRIDKLAFSLVQDTCYNLCCISPGVLSAGEKVTLCGDAITAWKQCFSNYYYRDHCYVDIMTFASLLIIEEAGGPQIPMVWGRKQADCRNVFSHITVDSSLDTRRISQKGSALSSFGNADAIFEDFTGLGFNKSEAVALMGAHSFGKIHKYTGGPRTRNRGGGFCNDTTKSEGFFQNGHSISKPANNAELLDAYSTPAGICKGAGKGEEEETTSEGALACWTNERGYLEAAREGSVKDDAQFIKYSEAWRGLNEEAVFWTEPGWGQGGFWDTTPNKFDNQYFVELNSTDASERNNCCGATTEYGCGTDGFYMQNKNGTHIDGCNVNWCMRSAEDTTGLLGGGNPKSDTMMPDYVMISTKMYVQSDTPRNDQAGHVGIHHLYRLAADWAIIEDSEAKAVVAEFAADETAFHNAFAAAWAKVVELGHAEGTLKTCEA